MKIKLNASLEERMEFLANEYNDLRAKTLDIKDIMFQEPFNGYVVGYNQAIEDLTNLLKFGIIE